MVNYNFQNMSSSISSLALHKYTKHTRNDDDVDADSDSPLFAKNDTWPRFMVLTSASEEKPLRKLSPFMVQKGIKTIARTPESTKRLRDGSFLMQCSRRAQVENLLRTVIFVYQPVQVFVHKSLNSVFVHRSFNSSRGVIRCWELGDMSEVEIRNELKTLGVLEVHCVTVKKEGKLIPTNTLFLRFN